MVDILQKELGTSYACEYMPNPYIGRYQFHTEANIESTIEGLGYEPRFSFEEGIKKYIPEIKRMFEEEVK